MSESGIIKIALPFFLLHAGEEFLFRYDLIDPTFQWIGSLVHLSSATVFLIEQLLVGALLIIAIWKPNKILSFIIGIAFLFELAHPINAFVAHSYAPGLLTSIPLIFLGFLFWRGLIKGLY